MQSSGKCLHSGCSKRPTYGVEASRKRECCSQHARPWMVNIDLTRCAKDNCETRATFGEPGSGRRQFCSKHAPKGMLNLERKKCSADDCLMPPTYWHEGNRKRRFCSKHAEDGMVKMDKKLCPVKGCFTSASYGVMGKKRKFCAVHAERGMVSIGGRRCAKGDCGKRANYGVAGTNKREFCATHAEAGMVNINNQKRGSVQRKKAGAISNKAGPHDDIEEESDEKPAVRGDGRRASDPSVLGEEEAGGVGASFAGSAEENGPVSMAADERNHSWSDPRLPVAATSDGGVWDLRGPCGVGISSGSSTKNFGGGGGGGGSESSAAYTGHRAKGRKAAGSPPMAAAEGVMGGHSDVKHEEVARNFWPKRTPTTSPGKDARKGAWSCSPKGIEGRAESEKYGGSPRSTSSSSSPNGRRPKRPKKLMRPWPKSNGTAVPLLLTSDGWSSWEWQPLAMG
ncbi:unnamed protein product [Ectocarpus sp. 4 AP-2014]